MPTSYPLNNNIKAKEKLKEITRLGNNNNTFQYQPLQTSNNLIIDHHIEVSTDLQQVPQTQIPNAASGTPGSFRSNLDSAFTSEGFSPNITRDLTRERKKLDMEMPVDEDRINPPLDHRPIINSNDSDYSEGDSDTRQFIIQNKSSNSSDDFDSINSQFHHIKDLDSFFKSIYEFHQGHGFNCILLNSFLNLFQFLFTIVFLFILFTSINYEVLFDDSLGNHRPWPNLWIKDPFWVKIWSSYWLFKLFFFVSMICFFINSYRTFTKLSKLSEIKKFYENCLKIDNNANNKISDHTWYQVQEKLLKVQQKIKLCIHKDKLTELDIYHRILRHKNYMVAMANKEILPSVSIPGLGKKINFLSNNLKFNYKILFFDSYFFNWSIFQNSYALKEKYKNKYIGGQNSMGSRNEKNILTEEFQNNITILAIINLICFPFILLWQLIYTFFTYVEMAKREPDVFGQRKFTEFSKLKLRHFNELEHEFSSRIARAHRPATKYLNSFQSYWLIILAQHLSYMFGAMLAVLIALTVYDEDVLKIEHALTVMGVLTAVVGILRGLIPKDEELNCPEQLMKAVINHLHYLPTRWEGNFHTEKVRGEFDKMFQLRANFIIEELLSPILIPYILYFKLRPRAREILEFFRLNTKNIEGVGDVCSLADMDASLLKEQRSGGSSSTQTSLNSSSIGGPLGGFTGGLALRSKDKNKIQMSIIHFKAVNKNWTPPNQKTENWLNQNFQSNTNLLTNRKISQEPDLAELMGSRSTYNYLDNTSTVSRDFGRKRDEYDRMNLMNSSMMRIYENYRDESRGLSSSPQVNINHDVDMVTRTALTHQMPLQQPVTQPHNNTNASFRPNFHQSTLTAERSLYSQTNENSQFRYNLDEEDSNENDLETSRF